VAVSDGPAGFGYRLRPVEQTDAADILMLRTDSERSRWLNQTPGTVEFQRHWIGEQRARGGDHYFVIETLDGRWEGVIALYRIEKAIGEWGRSGEWGRWVLRRGSLAAPASVLLIMGFGFDGLGLARIYGRTLAGNLSAISFHDACRYMMRAQGTYDDGRVFVEHSLLRSGWPAFRDTLAPVAQRVAQRSARP
jgi:RimJ/RimL family protein N-acetyltransferase